MNSYQHFMNRKVVLFSGSIILLLGIGLLLRSVIPSPKFPAASTPTTITLLPTNTITLPTRTNTPVVITPTATTALPQPTSAESILPPEFLARLNFGEIVEFALSPLRDKLVVASVSHICLFKTDGYELSWCSLAIPRVEMEEIEITSTEPRVRGLAFRPDGRQIAITLWNGYLVILDAEDGEQVNLIQTKRWIYNIAWSPGGRQIMIHSSQNGLEVWDALSGEVVQQIEIDPDNLLTVAWSADGAVFATADKEDVITFWDSDTYQSTGTLAVEITGWIASMAWSPEKTRIYAGIATPVPCEENCDPNEPGYQGWVASWFVESGQLASKVSVGEMISNLTVSPNGNWVAAGGGLFGSFIVLEGQSSKVEVKLSHTQADRGVGWLDNDHALYLPSPNHIDGQSISEWDVRFSERNEIFLPGFETIHSMAWMPDGERLVTNSAGGTISFWQAHSGQRLEQFKLSFGDLPVTKFSPTWMSPVKPWLAVSVNDSLAIVDLDTRQVVRWLDHAEIAPAVRVVDFAWSLDGSKLAGRIGYLDRGGLVLAVWDVSSGEILYQAPNDYDDVHAFLFSSDGRQLALSKTVRDPEFREFLAILDIQTGKEIQSLDTITGALWMYWLTDDQVAFDGCSKTQIWDLPRGRLVDTNLPARYPAVRPDGELAAYACPGGGISLWGFPNGTEVACLLAQSDHFGYRSMAFSPDGSLLASLTDGSSLILWDVSSDP